MKKQIETHMPRPTCLDAALKWPSASASPKPSHGSGAMTASSRPNSGAVTVLRGRRLEDLGGPARQRRPGLAANPVGLIPDVEDGEPFHGSALAAGDFDGNGSADLAIGATGRTQARSGRLRPALRRRLRKCGLGAWPSAAP